MEKICVFCGSASGNDPVYIDAARELGSVLAAMEIGLVYGGADAGLMGSVARAVLDGGGHVTGVLPRRLADREIAMTGLSELHVVETLSQRKALMAELSDGFIALPGGLGTLDEFVEMLTWDALGIHKKPCALLNTAGYFDPLLALFDRMVRCGFLRSEVRERIMLHDRADTLLMLMGLSR